MAGSVINADSKDIVSDIIESNDFFLFDCDGVLWSNGGIFPGVKETLNKLHALGKKILFVTNSSMVSREQCTRKINDYGIAAKITEVYCTSYTSAVYLKDKLEPEDEVYVVGNQSIAVELEKLGVKYFGIGPDDSLKNMYSDGEVNLRPNVKAVISGFDDYFTYSKITKATAYLANEDTLFVVTNLDANYRASNFKFRLPATGALTSSIITASERQPTVNCGKPNSFMMNCIRAEHDLDPSRTIMIGDRLDTDILFGKNNDIRTLLVMTGVTTSSVLEHVQRSCNAEMRNLIPDYCMQALSDLNKHF